MFTLISELTPALPKLEKRDRTNATQNFILRSHFKSEQLSYGLALFFSTWVICGYIATIILLTHLTEGNLFRGISCSSH